MTTISPDAVIDAIAEFADGIEYSPIDDADWPGWITDALFENGDPNDYTDSDVRTCVAALLEEGRLREIDVFDDGHTVIALSWSEQARRVCKALNSHDEPDGAMVRLIADVLAGKKELL